MRHSTSVTSLALAVVLFSLPAFAESTAPAAPPAAPPPMAGMHHDMQMMQMTPATPPTAQTPAAQAPAAPAMSGMMRGNCPMMKGMGGMGMNGMSGMMPMMTLMQHPEGQIAFIKTELKITPAQEPAWNAFADALRAQALQMKARHDVMMQQNTDDTASPKALPDSLSARIQMMELHLASLKSYQEALAKFYPSLSDEQKKLADDLLSAGQ